MVTILPFPCPSPRAVMGRLPHSPARTSWPDHVRSWRTLLGGLSLRVACLQLLRGPKLWPPGPPTHDGPSTTVLSLNLSNVRCEHDLREWLNVGFVTNEGSWNFFPTCTLGIRLLLKAWFKCSCLLWYTLLDLSQEVWLILGQASVTALSLCILLFTFVSSLPRLLEVRAVVYSFGFLSPGA